MRDQIAARRSRRLYHVAGVGLLTACGGDGPLAVGMDPLLREWETHHYLAVGRTIELDLPTFFNIPDSVTLRFHAETSDAGLVIVAVDDGALTLESVGGEGSADVTVWATDPRGRSAVADFAVFTDYGNSIELAAAASVGDTIQGVLGRADEDYFEVSVPTDAFRLRAFTQGDTDPEGALYDAGGTRIAHDYDTGAGDNFLIIRELAAGTYYVSVSRGAGSYSLILDEAEADDHGDSFATATSLSIGDTVLAVLTPGDHDYFEFPVPDGFTVRAFAQGDTDTNGVLYDGTGMRIASNNSAGEGLNFHIVRDLDAGTHYLSVSGWNTGTYTLILEEAGADDHGNSIASATPVSIGDTVPGVLTPGDLDYFEFPVPADGFRLSVFTQGTTDAVGTLYDGTGSRLADDDGSGEGDNFHIIRTLDAGRYYVRVFGSYRREAGYYSLVLEEAEPDDHGNTIATATSVSIGDTVPGVLAGQDRDFFEFSVPTDEFRLDAFTQGDPDTDGVLYDRNGSWIAHDYSSGEGSNFHITRMLDAGTYYLEVTGAGGSYLLILKDAGTDAAGSARDTGRPGVAAVPPSSTELGRFLTAGARPKY